MDLGRFRGADEVRAIYFWLGGFGMSSSHLCWLCGSLFLPGSQQGAWNQHNQVLASSELLNLGFVSAATDTQLPI